MARIVQANTAEEFDPDISVVFKDPESPDELYAGITKNLRIWKDLNRRLQDQIDDIRKSDKNKTQASN